MKNVDKQYSYYAINEKMFEYCCIFIFISFLVVALFFNNEPSNQFEIFIDQYLIKGRGVYSHIYPFPSEVISNLAMIYPPICALLIFSTSKVGYQTEQEILQQGLVIEKKLVKVIFLKIAGILALLLVIAILIFCNYIDYSDLEEVRRNTSFIRDNIVWVISLPYLFCIGSFIFFTITLGIISHPVKYLFNKTLIYQYSKNQKISMLMKEKRKKQ